MEESLFISICIPAYQRAEHLKRLLDSLEIQSFRRFEVVITDDSPGSELQNLVEAHPLKTLIRYFKNPNTLGSPENWNECLRRAKSDWIKFIHDDDWLSGPDSLQSFAKAIEKGGSRFYFSAFTNVFQDGHSRTVRINTAKLNALKKNSEILIASNLVGPPSVVIFKKDESIYFDNRMKWLVDLDFYIRYLKRYPAVEYISGSLVQIGISETQITSNSFGNPEIEIPERFMLQGKLNPATTRNLTIFDSWWRFLRNLSIRDTSWIDKAGYKGEIPGFIKDMIRQQNKIPRALLKQGLFSKLFMFMHFLRSRKA